MNTARRGNAAEVRTAKILQEQGWVVGSRRHIPGPGDLLAYKRDVPARLIEVKATRTPYEHFRRPDREALVDFAHEHSLRPELAYWAPGASTHQIIGSHQWP